MDQASLKEASEKQRAVWQKYRREKPELFQRGKPLNDEEILKTIGIRVFVKNRPKGYLRLFPQDFVVEEVDLNGQITSVEPALDIEEQLSKLSRDEEQRTLYADLVKVNLAQFDLTQLLMDRFGLARKQIGFAGIKDTVALTAQKISFRDFIDLEELSKAEFTNFYLQNFHFGKGVMAPGMLKGNRFTILIRTEKEVTPEFLFQNLSRLQEGGCLNYFHLQRFGGLRLMAHVIGAYLARGEFEKAVLATLCHSSPYEILLIKRKREAAKKLFPDFAKIEEMYAELPITFQTELRLLLYLKENPKDYLGALASIPEHTKIWVMAYLSYLFNSLLSDTVLKKQKLPREISSLFSRDGEGQKIYAPWLKKHGTENYFQNLRQLGNLFILLDKKQPTKIYPEIIKAGIVPEGVIISFILPKGAYATTLLANLFELTTGTAGLVITKDTVPPWVKKTEYDVKASLGLGSVLKVKEILGEAMKRKDETEEKKEK